MRDLSGQTAIPGLVDTHMHVGIYSPLAEDAVTESKAAAMGGVTTGITYFRTGQYYLNKGGSYRDFYPEVLDISNGNYYVDYAYHLAPIAGSHIDEMEYLLTEQGVSSFKIFMFYGGYGLHGKTDKGAQREFLMIGEDDSYDIAHFEFIMRSASRLMKQYPDIADQISVSLHCELADILNAYTKIVQSEGKLTGLRAYSAARPPHSEGLAIWIASYLAYETECLNINLLHLTSRKAVEAALMMQKTFPHINFGKEVTIGHLLLDYDAPTQCHAKVNPPIRSREDVEYLWERLIEGDIDWVVSDHACCAEELKVDGQDHRDGDNIWVSKSGFGGTEYLLSGLFSSRATNAGLRCPTWPGWSAPIRPDATASITRVIWRLGSTPTWPSSTPVPPSSCAQRNPNRPRGIRRSRAWNSAARSPAPTCEDNSSGTRVRWWASRVGSTSTAPRPSRTDTIQS